MNIIFAKNAILHTKIETPLKDAKIGAENIIVVIWKSLNTR